MKWENTLISILTFLNTNENLPAKKGIRSLQIASSF